MRALRALALGLLSACIRSLQVVGTADGELLVGVGRADVTGPVADVTFMVGPTLVCHLCVIRLRHRPHPRLQEHHPAYSWRWR